MLKKIRGVLVAVAPAGLALPSLAAVPAGAEAIFTGAATDFGTVVAYGFTAMAAIVGGMIVFNLVRSIAKKSTKA